MCNWFGKQRKYESDTRRFHALRPLLLDVLDQMEAAPVSSDGTMQLDDERFTPLLLRIMSELQQLSVGMPSIHDGPAFTNRLLNLHTMTGMPGGLDMARVPLFEGNPNVEGL